MDATTVQEVANQLHIGVNEVAQYIPSYAQSEIFSCFMWIIITISLIAISGILSLVFLLKENKWERISIENANYIVTDVAERELYYKANHLEDCYHNGKWISFVIFCIAFIFGLLIIPTAIESIILWTNAPEMTMLQRLL